MSSYPQVGYDHAHAQATLRELADLGMVVLKRHQADVANAAPTGRMLMQAVITFDRIARAIRRTIALSHHLQQPAVASRVAKLRADQPASAAGPLAGATAIERVGPANPHERPVVDAEADVASEGLHSMGPGSPTRVRDTEYLERRERTELDEVRTRPFYDVVASICRDLAISCQPHWPQPPPATPNPAKPRRPATRTPPTSPNRPPPRSSPPHVRAPGPSTPRRTKRTRKAASSPRCATRDAAPAQSTRNAVQLK